MICGAETKNLLQVMLLYGPVVLCFIASQNHLKLWMSWNVCGYSAQLPTTF